MGRPRKGKGSPLTDAAATGEKFVQGTLFGVNTDAAKRDATFRTLKDRLGHFPVTVFEVNHQDKLVDSVEQEIGDVGALRDGAGKSNLRYLVSGPGSKQTRDGSFSKATDDESVYRGKVTVSIFNPAICQWVLSTFGHNPATGKVCYDPFAGGGTRAVLAAKHGYTYKGMEIRADEVAAVRARCEKNGVAGQVEILHGDAQAPPLDDYLADFILTCPPYYNLETYGGGGNDLSMAPTYNAFLTMLDKVVSEATRIAKRRCTAVWVVGLHRRENDGWLLPLHHDLTTIHRQHGWRFDEEIILYHKNNGAIQRVGMFDCGKGHLIRLHEYALVYQLGG